MTHKLNTKRAQFEKRNVKGPWIINIFIYRTLKNDTKSHSKDYENQTFFKRIINLCICMTGSCNKCAEMVDGIFICMDLMCG